jgi:hypothetical protein
MKYYSIECRVPGPVVDCPVGVEDGLPAYSRAVVRTAIAGAAIGAVRRGVEACFKELEIKTKLAYAFPDGSLYLYAEAPSLEMKDIPGEAQELIYGIAEVPWDQDPHKTGVKTVKEYMDA